MFSGKWVKSFFSRGRRFRKWLILLPISDFRKSRYGIMEGMNKKRKTTFRTTIRNYTEVPDDLIREMIAFAKPPGTTGFEIAFKNTRPNGWRGWAYSGGTGMYVQNGRHPWKPLITVFVPKGVNGKQSPCPVNGYDNRADVARARRFQRGYMTGGWWTDHERLLHLIAHEMRHLWQRRVKRGRRVWGARGQMSERDADAYAIGIVRRWRRR